MYIAIILLDGKEVAKITIDSVEELINKLKNKGYKKGNYTIKDSSKSEWIVKVDS